MPASSCVFASSGATPRTLAKHFFASANCCDFSASIPLRYSSAASNWGTLRLGVDVAPVEPELPIANVIAGMTASMQLSAARAAKVACIEVPLLPGVDPRITIPGEWRQLNHMVQAS